MSRVRLLSGLDAQLGATSSEKLIDLLDSIPLVSRAKATSIVRDFESTVADAAEKRVRVKIVPEVEAVVKKGLVASIGISTVVGLLIYRASRR